MRQLLAALLLALLTASAWAEQPVKVNIAWRYQGFPATAAIYEVQGQPHLWETQSVASLAAAPVAGPIAGSSFSLLPGHKKRFALVVQNTSDKPLYFFAAPHTVQPEERALGFKFKCLCVNRAYTIAPGQTWYRILEFRLSEDFDGPEVTLTHTLIGIDEKRAASFTPEASMPEM